MEKYINKYTKLYKKVLIDSKLPNIKIRVKSYEQRLKEMIQSNTFKKHNIYPTINTYHVYGVIAMCLELKKDNLSDNDIIRIVNSGFEKRRNSFLFLYKIINNLPFSYKIAEKWNISDHEKRIQDGSITYDLFEVRNNKIEYRISKCMYIEMFEYYDIRSLCKIFCLTDEYAYAHISKNIQFIRHSDLSCGNCCHDIIINKKCKE